MECTFCGRDIRKGSESMYVTSKGKLYYFCSSKCEKNLLKLGRSKRKAKWTATYAKEKEARLRLLKEGVKPEEIKKLEKKAEVEEEKKAEATAEQKTPEKPKQEKAEKQKHKEKKPESKK
jgi:large subunit ribosomal protein L24e